VTIGDPYQRPVCRASLEVFDKGTGSTVAIMAGDNAAPTH
jgi:hypothetical protein